MIDRRLQFRRLQSEDLRGLRWQKKYEKGARKEGNLCPRTQIVQDKRAAAKHFRIAGEARAFEGALSPSLLLLRHIETRYSRGSKGWSFLHVNEAEENIRKQSLKDQTSILTPQWPGDVVSRDWTPDLQTSQTPG